MKTYTDEDLYRVHQEGTRRHGREGCLSGEELGRAAAGELSPRDRARVADHVVACADCADELRVLRQLREQVPGWLPEVGEAAAASRPEYSPPAWWRRWPAWVAAGAAVALAVVLSITLREATPDLGSPPVLRAANGPQVRSLLPGDQSLSRESCLLRWSALPGARYVVTVSTPDLRILHVARGLVRARYQVPAATLAKIPPGGRFVWAVEAYLGDGRRLAPAAFEGRLE